MENLISTGRYQVNEWSLTNLLAHDAARLQLENRKTAAATNITDVNKMIK